MADESTSRGDRRRHARTGTRDERRSRLRPRSRRHDGRRDRAAGGARPSTRARSATARAVSTPRCWACCCSSAARSCSSPACSRPTSTPVPRRSRNWPPQGMQDILDPFPHRADPVPADHRDDRADHLVRHDAVGRSGASRRAIGRGMNRALVITLMLGIVFLSAQAVRLHHAARPRKASASTAASTARSSTR